MRILLVEDEKRLNDTVRKYLEDKGYSVDSCYDGGDAYLYITGAEYDAVVLDIMLPGMDGLSLLRKIRGEKNDVPVLLLTARGEISNKVEGLDSGADDYMAKPFSLEELAARLRVMIRRGGAEPTEYVLKAADLEMDTKTHRVSRGQREIKLTAKEYAILEYLLHNKGMVLSREKIEQHIWNYDYEGGSNIIDVYVRTLRKKIKGESEDSIIETVRGTGYVIR